MSIPAPWAPMELTITYELPEQDRPPNPLLDRMVSDPRMEAVWRAITKERKAKISQFPIILYSLVAIIQSYDPPQNPISEIKEKHREIAKQARKLKSLMSGSLLDEEFITQVSVIEIMAEVFADFEVEYNFWPYIRFARTGGMGDPKKTTLARLIHRIFMIQFETPLWDHIATLVEVVLDLEADTVTRGFVIKACKKPHKVLSTNMSLTHQKPA